MACMVCCFTWFLSLVLLPALCPSQIQTCSHMAIAVGLELELPGSWQKDQVLLTISYHCLGSPASLWKQQPWDILIQHFFHSICTLECYEYDRDWIGWEQDMVATKIAL